MTTLSPSQPQLDTCYPIETPEGIDLLLYPAGPMPRSLAFAIDLLIRGALLLLTALILSLLGAFGSGLLMLIYFLLNWWYMVLFEVYNQGRSPGKQLLGLRVVQDDGTPVSWGASLTRNLLRVVDMLPFGYMAGLLASLNHPTFKRLGDLAAGTLVIYQDTPATRSSLPDGESHLPPAPLTLSEQRAILSLAERQHEISAERRAEICEILADTLQVAPEQAERRLQGVARSLLGSA